MKLDEIRKRRIIPPDQKFPVKFKVSRINTGEEGDSGSTPVPPSSGVVKMATNDGGTAIPEGDPEKMKFFGGKP